MRFVSFASSSKGNCALVSYKDTNIIIDCGISRKRLVGELSIYGLTLSDIDAILVTHEHDDHIMGLPSVLKENKIKILSQRDTLNKIASYCENKGTKVNLETFKVAHPVNTNNEGVAVIIKDIEVYPIKGSHDVASVFYKMTLGNVNIAIVTDTGMLSDAAIRSINDVDFLMLECNYDIERLLDSTKYPAFLKSRIMGDRGHLSNVQCSESIMKLKGNRLKKVYLSHISEETNSEEYAYEFVTKYLKNKCKEQIELPEICISKRLEKTIILDDQMGVGYE